MQRQDERKLWGSVVCFAATPNVQELVKRVTRGPSHSTAASHHISRLALVSFGVHRKVKRALAHSVALMLQPLNAADDVRISFARSGGAGGQNVNKVNTKVDMRLKLDAAVWLSEEMRDALSVQVRSLVDWPCTSVQVHAVMKLVPT